MPIIFFQKLYDKVNKNRFSINTSENILQIASDTRKKMKNVKISVKGQNNVIILNPKCLIKKAHISIKGSNNKVTIGSSCYYGGGHIYLTGNSNQLSIGENTTIENADFFLLRIDRNNPWKRLHDFL